MPTAGAVAGAGTGAGAAVAVASATTSCAASTVSGWLSFAQTISRVVEVVFVRLITTAKMPALDRRESTCRPLSRVSSAAGVEAAPTLHLLADHAGGVVLGGQNYGFETSLVSAKIRTSSSCLQQMRDTKVCGWRE